MLEVIAVKNRTLVREHFEKRFNTSIATNTNVYNVTVLSSQYFNYFVFALFCKKQHSNKNHPAIKKTPPKGVTNQICFAVTVVN